MCGIYIYINRINNKIYIGQSRDVEERDRQHCNNNKQHIDKAITKYGRENFTFGMLEEFNENISDEELNNAEKYYIKYYNTFNTAWGYNHQSGGENHTMSDEAKEKQKMENHNTHGLSYTGLINHPGVWEKYCRENGYNSNYENDDEKSLMFLIDMYYPQFRMYSNDWEESIGFTDEYDAACYYKINPEIIYAATAEKERMYKEGKQEEINNIRIVINNIEYKIGY